MFVEGLQHGRVPPDAGVAGRAVPPGLALEVTQHVVDAGVARLPSVDPHLDQGLENQLTAHPPGLDLAITGVD